MKRAYWVLLKRAHVKGRNAHIGLKGHHSGLSIEIWSKMTQYRLGQEHSVQLETDDKGTCVAVVGLFGVEKSIM